ncbi:MAG: ABC transporter permease [Lachnospiraceae bacterium]|nr:ABC transporter permease [Lachnospiraceae bacterium]
MRNPLIKRIPRELKTEWHKYLVIILFMVLMIGVISGMYVGHDSMLAAIHAGWEKLKLEDGSFELSHKASQELLSDIGSGEKADVRAYLIEKGQKEADKEVAKQIDESLRDTVTKAIGEGVRAQCQALGITDEALISEQIDAAMQEGFDAAYEEARAAEEFKDAEKEAYEKAHEEVTKKVDEKWGETVDRYDLDNADFVPQRVRIFEHFYREEAEDYNKDGTEDATVRIYMSNSDIDQASFNEGRMPQKENEIAIDRMHAENVGIKIGDTIRIGERDFQVVGLLSYVNYLTLHESNTDLMFDAFGFDVAMVTPEGFRSLRTRVHYSYAFQYEKKPEGKEQLADASENLLKALITQTLVYDNEIEDYLPEYLRQASNFAVSDIEGDLTSTGILCYILIAVIAFIFAITISNTIDKEASVIGTLRASGYSRTEMVVHYMSMPVIVTLLGALIGNVLGYTTFRDVAVNLYYQSYSLPACSTVWSNVALVKTTLIPLTLMFCINLYVIIRKLQISPLRFLRHDLKKTKKSRAMRLPRWSFLRRFRLRILLQNMPNYLILIFGVIFIELMLCFAFGIPDSLDHYADSAEDMILSEYQYMLMDSTDADGEIITTSEKSAEPFCMTSLLFPKETGGFRTGMGSGGDESVSVYGLRKDSAYAPLGEKTGEDGVYLSSAFCKKFSLTKGDVITLHEEYENKSYTFRVKGSIEYDGGIAAFMDEESFRKVFDKKEDEFSGFFSHHRITDIDEQLIATVITKEDIVKVTNQLTHSIGGALEVFKYVLIVLAAALIYLLAKIIIERNEHSISMAKILGFLNGEISSLYILPTAMIVVLFSLISFGVGFCLMIWIFRVFVLQMDGYFSFFMSPSSMILSILYLLIGYTGVSLIDFFRIKRIPLDVALKNIE